MSSDEKHFVLSAINTLLPNQAVEIAASTNPSAQNDPEADPDPDPDPDESVPDSPPSNPARNYVYINGQFVPDIPPDTSENAASEQASRIDEIRESRQREVTIELEARFNGRLIGQVITRTTLTQPRVFQANQLRMILEPVIDEGVFQRLLNLDGEFISVGSLSNIGISITLDQANLSLVVDAPARDRGPLDIDLSAAGLPEDAVTIQPARFSAGLTSVLSLSDNLNVGGSFAADVGLSGYFNFGGVRGINLDYGGIIRLDDQSRNRFEADRTILFMDRPEQALRYEAGTLFNELSDLAGNSDFLGFGVRRSYRTLQPTRVIRRLGRRSFTLERPGEVTVLVNGQEVSRFDAGTGPINLDNIPLVNVSNDVSIIVEDEFGRRVGDNFSVATDAFLLERGLTEFAIGAGQVRDTRVAGFEFTDDFSIGGNIQHGFTEGFTQGGYAFYSREQAIAGSESVFALLSGIAELELSASHTRGLGTGIAINTSYRLDDSLYNELGQSFAFVATYRDQDYTPIGTFFRTDLKLDASAFYDRSITERFRLNLSGTYNEFHQDSRRALSASVGGSYQFGPAIVSGGVRYTRASGGSDQVGVFVSLTRRLGARHSVNATYDSVAERGAVGLRRARRDEVGNLGYRAEMQSLRDELAFNGVADYTGNRFNGRIGIRQGSGGGQFQGDTTATVRVQSGIAFADGVFGVARDPGRGFALVSRHESLSGATVEIPARSRRSIRSRSDFLGPASFRVTSPFQPQVYDVDLKDAPFGYDIGAGRYVAVPGARSGYHIQIGSENYRARMVTFARDGEALGLKIGQLINVETERSQVIFTNRAGRAVLSDLAPGRYRATFDQSRLTFEFTIAEDSPVYEDLGTIDLLPGDGE